MVIHKTIESCHPQAEDLTRRWWTIPFVPHSMPHLTVRRRFRINPIGKTLFETTTQARPQPIRQRITPTKTRTHLINLHRLHTQDPRVLFSQVSNLIAPPRYSFRIDPFWPVITIYTIPTFPQHSRISHTSFSMHAPQANQTVQETGTVPSDE